MCGIPALCTLRSAGHWAEGGSRKQRSPCETTPGHATTVFPNHNIHKQQTTKTSSSGNALATRKVQQVSVRQTSNDVRETQKIVMHLLERRFELTR